MSESSKLQSGVLHWKKTQGYEMEESLIWVSHHVVFFFNTLKIFKDQVFHGCWSGTWCNLGLTCTGGWGSQQVLLFAVHQTRFLLNQGKHEIISVCIFYLLYICFALWSERNICGTWMSFWQKKKNLPSSICSKGVQSFALNYIFNRQIKWIEQKKMQKTKIKKMVSFSIN